MATQKRHKHLKHLTHRQLLAGFGGHRRKELARHHAHTVSRHTVRRHTVSRHTVSRHGKKTGGGFPAWLTTILVAAGVVVGLVEARQWVNAHGGLGVVIAAYRQGGIPAVLALGGGGYVDPELAKAKAAVLAAGVTPVPPPAQPNFTPPVTAYYGGAVPQPYDPGVKFPWQRHRGDLVQAEPYYGGGPGPTASQIELRQWQANLGLETSGLSDEDVRQYGGLF